MSEKVRNKGIEEIFRVLKPQGRLLVLDLAELRPIMESSGFSQIEISQAKFRVIGLPILSFV